MNKGELQNKLICLLFWLKFPIQNFICGSKPTLVAWWKTKFFEEPQSAATTSLVKEKHHKE